jgi:hypothetical protein
MLLVASLTSPGYGPAIDGPPPQAPPVVRPPQAPPMARVVYQAPPVDSEVPVAVKAPAKTKLAACCSDLCTCGCVEGGVCSCKSLKPSVATPVANPQVLPAVRISPQPYQQLYQPAFQGAPQSMMQPSYFPTQSFSAPAARGGSC